MISKYTYSGLTWIDLESPSQEEILHIMEESSIPATLGENINLNEQGLSLWLPLSLYFPRLSNDINGEEITFFLGPQSIITIHNEPHEALKVFSRTFEADAIYEKDLTTTHSGILFHHMITSLYSDLSRKLGEKRKHSDPLSLRKTLLSFKDKLDAHKENFDIFSDKAIPFYGESYTNHVSEIRDMYNKIYMDTDNYIETANEIHSMHMELQIQRARKTINIMIVVICVLVISNLIFILI